MAVSPVWRIIIGAGLALLLQLQHASSSGLMTSTIKITIDAGGVAHTGNWPVCGGIPFPRGALLPDGGLRAVLPNGEELPIQAEPISHWPDGSVRWVLVEAIVDLGNVDGFALEYGSGVRQRSAGDALLPGVGPSAWNEELTGPDGRRFTRKPAGPTQELGGLVHRTSLTTGRYADTDGPSPFGYRTRIHQYANLPLMVIEHTLTVEEGDPMAELGGLAMFFPDTPPVEPVARPASDDSPPDRSFSKLSPSDPATEGGIARRSVQVTLRKFDENWPKAIASGPGGVRLELFPRLDPDQYSNAAEPREMLYYWFEDGLYKLRRGVHKTHDILYSWDVSPSDAVRWFEHRPILRADVDWICSTGAAGALEPAALSPMPKYEEVLRREFDAVENRGAQLPETGFLNFGDWYGERGRNWGNSEYDLGCSLWLQWLRSGDRRFLDRAREAASHMADVDTVHSDASDSNVGKQWIHAVGHTGGYYPDGSFDMEHLWTRGHLDTGHIWTEGLFGLYCTTGDRRLLENALMTADSMVRAAPEFRMGTERNVGWPVLALVAAYEHTNDPRYLEAAKMLARLAMGKQDATTGGWLFPIGECRHDPKHVGGKTFMAGVLLTSFARLHSCLDDSVAEERFLRRELKLALLRGCDWLRDVAWQEDRGGFFYAQCPDHMRPCGAAPWMTCQALAYATELSGDARYVELAVRAVEGALDRGLNTNGKHLAMEMRFSPHFLASLRRLRSAQ